MKVVIKSKFHENKDWNPYVMEIHMWQIQHQEQVPRKQGLKLIVYGISHVSINDIKSKFHENKDWNQNIIAYRLRKWSSRASSTKTRIETPSNLIQRTPTRQHQEQVPRKQGLKLIPAVAIVEQVAIKSKFHENKDWNPLTLARPGPKRTRHQEQVPRKQGLKQKLWMWWPDRPGHQEQVPRKQGLKLSFGQTSWNTLIPSRASSTKTRIETCFG